MVDNIRKEVCENRNISEINRAYVNKPDSKANAAIQIRATQQRQESGHANVLLGLLDLQGGDYVAA